MTTVPSSRQDATLLTQEGSVDTVSILEEAQAVIEGQTKENIPDIPTNLPEDILSERRERSSI